MSTIGTIAISMVANTEAWTAGLSKGSKALESFATSTAAHLKAVPGIFADVFKGIATGAVAAGGALVALTAIQANNIDKTGDMADRLGTTTAALSELRYAAKLTGSEVEDLEPALLKMSALLGDAARQGGPTADALAKLGLDARTLAAMDPTQAFLAISGAFQMIPSAAERASYAMDIFGKGGVKLLNSLSAGPEELARLSAEFRKFGGSVSEAQRQGIGTMFDSLDRLMALIEGVGAQLAVQLAPFITAAVDEFIAMGLSGETMGQRITNALESVVKGIAVALDGLEGFNKRLMQVSDEWERFNGIVGAGGGLGRVALPAMKALGFDPAPVKTWGQSVEDVFERIRAKAAGMGDSVGGAGKKIGLLSEEFKETAKAVKDLEESLEAQIQTFGLVSRETELYKLSLKGATDEELAGARAKSELLEGAEHWKAVLSPMEKYAEKLKNITYLRQQDAISYETFAKAELLARRERDGDMMTKRAGAMEQGSSEAYSAILNYEDRQGRDTFAKDAAQAAKATAKNTTEGNKIGMQTLQAIQSLATNLTGQALQAFKIGG